MKFDIPLETFQHLYEKFNPVQIAQLYQVRPDRVWDYLKRNGIKKIAPWERLNLPNQLTATQQEILVGNLLGDGSLQKVNANASFSFTQSRQRAGYVRWLKNRLEPFVSPRGIAFATQTYPYKGKQKISYIVRFFTHCHPIFTQFHKLFYPQGKKIVPGNIQELLTPLGLAMWYADDGSNSDKRYYTGLNSQGFDRNSLDLLTATLKDKFQVEVGEGAQSPGLLVVRAASKPRFFDIVTPYLQKIPCIRYKISNRYLSKSSRVLTDYTPNSLV